MATEASSLANLYQDQDDIAKCFGHIVYNIINSSIDFEVVDFEAHDPVSYTHLTLPTIYSV